MGKIDIILFDNNELEILKIFIQFLLREFYDLSEYQRKLFYNILKQNIEIFLDSEKFGTNLRRSRLFGQDLVVHLKNIKNISNFIREEEFKLFLDDKLQKLLKLIKELNLESKKRRNGTKIGISNF